MPLPLRGYPEIWIGKKNDLFDSERIFPQQRSARIWATKVFTGSSIPRI